MYVCILSKMSDRQSNGWVHRNTRIVTKVKNFQTGKISIDWWAVQKTLIKGCLGGSVH